MLNTRITKLFGIRYPIIQGAMLWLSPAELAAAVSNAGGMGIIASSSFPTIEEFKAEILKAKALTDKPFCVNITTLPSRRLIQNEAYIEAAGNEQVKVIETAGRSPEPYMTLLRQTGALLMHKAARVKDIEKAEALGFDAVTIVGHEAAGHPGMDDAGTIVLVRKASESVKIPVIAGGGFADGRGLLAALALGAEAVQFGTRFMLSKECPMNKALKQFLLGKTEADTHFILNSIQNGARVVRTDFSNTVAAMESRGASFEEIFPFIAGTRTRAVLEGIDPNAGMLFCSQAIGLIHDAPPAGEIVDKIAKEAESALSDLSRICE